MNLAKRGREENTRDYGEVQKLDTKIFITLTMVRTWLN